MELSQSCSQPCSWHWHPVDEGCAGVEENGAGAVQLKAARNGMGEMERGGKEGESNGKGHGGMGEMG